jgi:1,4-dihydroxy-2-naphthoate polyprenyltransferase
LPGATADSAFLPWLALAFGLILAHASNNIFNDYTDFVRGVDKDNYYRNIYGAQPVASGLMTKRQHLTYFAVTALIALVFGLYLAFYTGFSTTTWILIGLGAFFLLFYTWPLKGLALGEVAVLDRLGTVDDRRRLLRPDPAVELECRHRQPALRSGRDHGHFGKHIDKLDMDKAKGIHTLPVVLGEKISRYAVLVMMIAPYLFTVYLIAVKFFTPVMLIVFRASHLPSDLSQVSGTQANQTSGGTNRLAAVLRRICIFQQP